jgi:manganese oxidase
MHIHGGPVTVAARDGITLLSTARFEADTVNVGPGQRFDVTWRALNPVKWLIHCHIGHHDHRDRQRRRPNDGHSGIRVEQQICEQGDR